MKSTHTFSDPFNVKITAVVDVDNFYCILSSDKPVFDKIQQMLKEEVGKFEMMRKPIPGDFQNYLSHSIEHDYS
jgi:hypothetical protein